MARRPAAALRDLMNMLGNTLNAAFNPAMGMQVGVEGQTAFVLIAFPMDDPSAAIHTVTNCPAEMRVAILAKSLELLKAEADG